MKKKQTLLLLCVASLLAACGENTDKSSDPVSSEPSSSDSSLTPTPVDKEALVAGVIDGLKEAVEASSMSVYYTEKDTNEKDVNLVDIYTSDYVSFGWSKSGYLLLDSFDKDYGDKLVYSFSYDSKGDIELGKATTYYDENDKLVGVNSCTDMNPLKLFKKGNKDFNNGLGLTKASFYYKNGAVHSDDEEVLSIMCSLMGYTYGDSETRIYDVTFLVEEDGSLSFTLYNQPDENSSNLSAFLTGKFGKLNETSDEKLANFVATYKLPTVHLEQSTKELLKAPTIGFNTEIKYRTSSSSTWTSYGKTGITSAIGSDRKEDKIAYSLEDKTNEETYTYILTKGEKTKEGLTPAIDHYIDGQNKVATQEFEKKDFTWGNGIFSFQDEIDADSFLGENNKFTYFGFNTDRLFESLAGLTVLTDIIMQDVTSMTLEINGNTLTFRSYLDAYYADANGNETELKLLATSSIIKDASIAIPSSYESEDAENAKLNQAINHLKEVSWTANGYGLSTKEGQEGEPSNELPKTNYYYKKGSYFIQDWANRRLFSKDSKEYTRQGYKQVEGGIIPFKITREANVQGVQKPGTAYPIVSQIDTTDTLEAHFGFNFSSKVFQKGSTENTFVLRDNVKHISSNIMGSVKLDYLVDKSLVITLDESNRLSKINYKYVYGGVMTGKEELKFEYDDATKLAFPSKVVNEDSFNNLSTDLPTKWSEESKVKAIMVKTFGATVTDLIPYLPQFGVSYSWETTPNYDRSGDICIYNKQMDDTYLANYKSLLSENGYSNQTIGEYDYLVKDYETKETVTDANGDEKEVEFIYTVRIRFGEKASGNNTYDTSDNIYLGCKKAQKTA